MATHEMTVLLTCWLVFLSIRSARANIACYSCNSNYIPPSTAALNCNETFNPEGIETCNNGMSCGKRVFNCTGTDDECMRLHSARRGTNAQRYCNDQVVTMDMCNTTVYDKATEVICLCNSDKCNGNPTTKVNDSCTVKHLIDLTFVMAILSALFAEQNTVIVN